MLKLYSAYGGDVNLSYAQLSSSFITFDFHLSQLYLNNFSFRVRTNKVGGSLFQLDEMCFKAPYKII